MLSFFKSFSSQIHSQYSVSNTEVFRVGPWVVYDGKSRQTKEPVSVFVLDKRVLADSLTAQGYKSISGPKAEVYEYANKGVSRLAKMRHPAVVKLVEPMENSRGALMFVTERVITSLGRLIKSKVSTSTIDNDDLNELVIVRGMAMLVDGLRFLHDQLGYVHLNVTPSTVLIDANGDWKLFGLEFLESYREITGDYFFPQLDPRMPSYLSPNPDYMAPELALHHNLSPKNDVFSLACLLSAIYSGKPPMSCRGNLSNYKDEYATASRKVQSITFPSQLQPLVMQLFDGQPMQRITLTEFAESNYFNNSLIKALQFLDDFTTKSASEKVQFLKKFNSVIDQFPKSVLQRKVLKFALAELTGPKDAATGELLASLVFTIAGRGMSRLTFSEQIQPLFGELKDFLPFQEAVGGHLDTIVKCTSEKDFTSEVVPVLLAVFKTGENSQTNLQRHVLDKGNLYLGHVTIAGLEQSLFPSVIELFAATPAKSVKISATSFFSIMIDNGLSKSLIQDKLVPALQSMKTRDPEVVMKVGKLYQAANAKLPVNVVVEKTLPQILELSMGKDLTVSQFNTLFASVRHEMDRIETHQKEALKHNREVVTTDPKSHQPVSKTVEASVSDIFDSQKSTPQTYSSPPKPAEPSTSQFHPPRGSFALNKPASSSTVSSPSLMDMDPLSSPFASQPTKPPPQVRPQPVVKPTPQAPVAPASSQWAPLTPSAPQGSSTSDSKYASLL